MWTCNTCNANHEPPEINAANRQDGGGGDNADNGKDNGNNGRDGQDPQGSISTQLVQSVRGLEESVLQSLRGHGHRDDDVLSYADVQKQLPKFSAPTVARTWEHYIRRVMKAIRDNKIADHRRASLLYSKIEGDAEKIANALSQNNLDDFDALVAALTKKFVKIRDREKAKLVLYGECKRKENS